MLKKDIEQYIELHRSTGFKFKQQSYHLRNFVRFASSRREKVVKTNTVLEWAKQAPSPCSRTERLRVIRRFARTMAPERPGFEIPPMIGFGEIKRRKPHIFSSREIGKLLAAASKLHPTSPLRPSTYVTLFGLLVATGLRISEALALNLENVTDGGLIIRETKFRKSRLVPLHSTVRDGLDRYLRKRKRAAVAVSNVFVSSGGGPMPYSTVVATYLALARKIGLRSEPGCSGARIHDLRHTFAVRSLEKCKGGRDAIQRHMHALSTYLGHAHIWDTFWYLHSTPKLLSAIAKAAERSVSGGDPWHY